MGENTKFEKYDKNNSKKSIKKKRHKRPALLEGHETGSGKKTSVTVEVVHLYQCNEAVIFIIHNLYQYFF